MTVTAKREAIQLRYNDMGKKVVVTPKDQDRFVMSVEDAAQACRAYKNLIVFKDQFERLLYDLCQWCKQNKSRIREAFVTQSDSAILFLVVRKDIPYDREFEYKMVRKEIKVARSAEYDLIRLSSLALPCCGEEDYRAFLSDIYLRIFPYAK